MAMPWFIQAKDRVVGPLSEHDLQRLATDGRLRPGHRVAASADGPWLPAGTVPGLAFPAAGDAGGSPRPPAPAVPRPAATATDADAGMERRVFFWIAVAGGLVVAGLAVDSLVRLTSREKAQPAAAPAIAVATSADPAAAPAAAGSAADTPAATEPDPAATGDAGPEDAGTAGSRVLSTLTDGPNTFVVPGAGPGTCVIASGRVHDLGTATVRGEWPVLFMIGAEGSFSHDGMYFVKDKTKLGSDVVVHIFALPDGERIHEIRLAARHEKLVGFLCDNQHRLISVTASDKTSRVRIHGLADGKLIREFGTVGKVAERRVMIDATGGLIALVSNSAARIYDTEAATAIRNLAAPRGKADREGPFANILALAFSTDGQELAAVCSRLGDRLDRLVVWDSTGAVTEEHRLPAMLRYTFTLKPRQLQFAPDGSAWLLNNRYLFDRRLGTITASFQDLGAYHAGERAFLDADHVLAVKPGAIVALPIPRDLIRIAAEAPASGVEAVLKRGDGVTIEVVVDAVRFADPAEVAASWRTVVRNCLVKEGFRVDSSAPVEFRLHYAEEEGRRLQVTTGLLGLDKPTGQTVSETVCRWTATLRHVPTNRVFWSRRLQRGNPYEVLSREITDQSTRATTFAKILGTLDEVTLPTFVPADPEFPRLPVVARP